jgi:type 1 glutamine amidotransferase
MKKALIVWGGWDGHEPDKVAERFRGYLADDGFDVDVQNTLSAFDDGNHLTKLDLIVPIWTMSTIEASQSKNVQDAVASGVGLAGCHGGMCDAFRNDVGWQFMTGGQWVAHPGNDNTKYTVEIGPGRGELNDGIADFAVDSEQYYLHVDPAVKVWATTTFPVADGPHTPNGTVKMPQVWTKYWGQGRVFYNALGHVDKVFEESPEAAELMRRGLRWAAK